MRVGMFNISKIFKKKRQRFATCGLAEVCMSCHRNHSSIRFSGRDEKLRSRYIYIYIATSGLDLNTWQELYLIFISFGSLAVRFKYLRKPIVYHTTYLLSSCRFISMPLSSLNKGVRELRVGYQVFRNVASLV